MAAGRGEGWLFVRPATFSVAVHVCIMELVFVGGRVAELLVSESSGTRVRPTGDSDAVCENCHAHGLRPARGTPSRRRVPRGPNSGRPHVSLAARRRPLGRHACGRRSLGLPQRLVPSCRAARLRNRGRASDPHSHLTGACIPRNEVGCLPRSRRGRLVREPRPRRHRHGRCWHAFSRASNRSAESSPVAALTSTRHEERRSHELREQASRCRKAR